MDGEGRGPSASALLITSIRGRAGGPARITATGELDIATAAAFGIELARLIDERGPHVLIDASGLTFCDARGLAAIAAADAVARRVGGTVTLTRVRPQMAKILRITGLDRRLVRASRGPAVPSARPVGA